jgi:hypothetical protein
MKWQVLRLASGGWAVGLVVAVAGAAQASAPYWLLNDYNAPPPNGVHATITNDSPTGYTYTGSGTAGLPGTDLPDSRRRPKVYAEIGSMDTSTVGSTLTLTYDILWGGDADPSNESQDWRFGFVSSTANSGKGISLGANFDIGDLAGTTAYEFFTDSSVTSLEAGSSTMDSAFTETLNDAGDGTARFAQSNDDPFGDDVAFNDRTDTHRVTLRLERIADGYNLAMSWQNLVSGNTITNSTSISTTDFDPSIALAAGVTSWDRVGFFVNDDSIDGSGGPWVYTLSNVSVAAGRIPEPACAGLALMGLLAVGLRNRGRRS